MANNEEHTYTMGHSEHERQRLIQQSHLYENITLRFLESAGIGHAMKVLDVGSGAGDVAMAAAKLVGSEGQVIGVDMSPDSVAAANSRVKAEGFANIEFHAGDVDLMQLDHDFDAVIGRLVLMYLKQPEATLKRLAGHLKPGGIVAFQETELQTYLSRKHEDTPLANDLIDWGIEVFQRTGANTNMGMEIYSTFVNAGLPDPILRYEAPMGCHQSWVGYGYLAASFKSLLPLIAKLGIATAEQIDVDTMAERLRAEVVASKRPMLLPPHITAYSILPK